MVQPTILARDQPAAALRAGVRAGTLERVRRGAYTVAAPEAPRWERDRARGLARVHGISAGISGRFAIGGVAAAALRTQRVGFPARIEVLQDRKPSGSAGSDVARRFVQELPDEDIEWIDGVPVSTSSRTLLDCARLATPRTALVVADALVAELCEPDRFHREHSDARMERVRRRLRDRLDALGPARGAVQAREVIGYASPYADSAPESVLRWILLAHGLPEPIVQIEVSLHASRLRFGDLGWRLGGRSYVVEFDGAAKYDGRDDLLAEKQRQDDLADHGVVLRRVRSGELRRPAELIERLTRAVPEWRGQTWQPRRALAAPLPR